MTSKFEWDPQKAILNLEKHGITFEEAMSVFVDPLSLTVSDPIHSDEENRFIILGHSIVENLLVVVHADRGDRIRIISVRRATPAERRRYENEQE
ncbi:MAG: BrnT family toxin [Pyrinomonadaceae bacterium]